MSIKKELQTSKSDVVHKVVKAAIATIPGAGGALSELFTTLIAEPSSKRRDAILIQIDERLNNLASRIKNLDIEKLSSNKVFLSIVSQAYQIAIRTHQDEKIEALMNAIENSAIGELDDNLQCIFLIFIDSFTEWHLRLLLLFDNPYKVISSMKIEISDDDYTGFGIIATAYPKLYINNRELCQQIIKDLCNRGLIKKDEIRVLLDSCSMHSSLTTDFGKQFIEFISKHIR